MNEAKKRDLERFHHYFKHAFQVMVYDITRYPVKAETESHILPIHLELEQHLKFFERDYDQFSMFEKKKEIKLWYMRLIREFNRFYSNKTPEIRKLKTEYQAYRRLKVLVIKVGEVVRNRKVTA